MNSIEEAYQFSLKFKEKLSKKFDNKNSRRGHSGRSEGKYYGGHKDDQNNKDEAKISNQNLRGNP